MCVCVFILYASMHTTCSSLLLGLVCSHRVDRDVQEVVGRLPGPAVRRRWPVPPGGGHLPGPRLETGPDHHGCPACRGRRLHLVGAELGRPPLQHRQLDHQLALLLRQVSPGVGQVAAGKRKDGGGQAADLSGGQNQQAGSSTVLAGEGGGIHSSAITHHL